MKRIVVIILCAFILFTIASCGHKEENSMVTSDSTTITVPTTLPASPELENSTESTVPDIAEPEATEATASMLSREIRTLYPFYEDRAWITYNEDGTNYYGIIDKQGNVLSRMELHQNREYTPFSNGFAHTYNYETAVSMIIDTDGNITYQRDESWTSGEPKVIFRGAGILVTLEEVSDFYGVGFLYTIIGHDGNVLEQFTTEQEVYDITDCGKGVIRFRNKGYLCLQTHTWISDDITTQTGCENPNFTSTTSNLAVIGAIGEYEDEVSQLVLLSTDGSTKEVPVDISYEHMRQSNFLPVAGDYLFIHNPYSLENFVISVNIQTGEIYRLDTLYVENIDKDTMPICSNDRIIILLRGADGNLYNFIFDTHMKPTCGPVEYFSFNTFSDSIIIGGNSSNNQTAYDKDGNVKFSLAELGYSFRKSNFDNIVLSYSCGALLAYDNDFKPAYLDTEGNLLFDAYNFANTKHLETKG